MLLIWFVPENGERVPIELHLDATVQDLENATGVNTGELTHSGEPLKNPNDLLMDTGISMESTVYYDGTWNLLKLIETKYSYYSIDDIEKEDYVGRTLISTLIINKHINELRTLIYKFGCKLYSCRKQLIMYGYDVICNESNDILKLLIQANKDIYKSDLFTQTIGIQCAYLGRYNQIKLLIDEGIKIDEICYLDGNYICHNAVIHNNTYVLETFIKYGLNINKKNNRGETPYDIAVNMGYDDMVKLLTP